MNNIGVGDLRNEFQHPAGHSGVDQNDIYIDLLSRKLCPIHLTPLILHKKTRLGDDYTRERYGCMSCRCIADFVGDELKTDSVGRTLEFINLWTKESREREVEKNNPAAKSGVEV